MNVCKIQKKSDHRLATLLKKRLRQRYFQVSFTKFLRARFYRTASEFGTKSLFPAQLSNQIAGKLDFKESFM